MVIAAGLLLTIWNIFLTAHVASVNGQLTVEKHRVSTLAADQQGISNSLNGLGNMASWSDLNQLRNQVDTLTTCVNRYMKTVGDSGGFGYSYYLC